MITQVKRWRGFPRQLGQSCDDAALFRLGIGMKSVSGLFRRSLLRLLPPRLEALGRRVVEEERVAEQLFDRPLDLGSQRRDNAPEPFGLAALFFELFEIVANGLFARDGGERAEDG